MPNYPYLSKLQQIIKSKIFIIGFVLVLILSFIAFFVNYYSKVNIYSPLTVKIEYNQQFDVDSSFFGISAETPTNNSICFRQELTLDNWENTYGIYSSVYLHAPVDKLYQIAAVQFTLADSTFNIKIEEILEYNKIKKYEDKCLVLKIPITDNNYKINRSINKTYLIIKRLFSHLLFTILFLVLIFIMLVFLISKRKINENYLYNIGIIIISFFVVFVVFNNNLLIHNDSASYLGFGFQRPPLYCLYVNFFKSVLSLDWLMLGINIFSGIFIAFILVKQISDFFNLNIIYKFIMFCILMYPYVSTFLFVANYMIAESIAYPLFLLFLFYIIRTIESDFKKSEFINTLIVFVLLILTRGQFVIIYPSVLFLSLYPFIKKYNKRWFYIMFFIFAIFFIKVIDSTYHYFAHDNFCSTHFGGYVLSVNAFYSSTPEDSLLFEGESQKTFINVSSRLEKHRLRYSFVKNLEAEEIHNHFFESYDDIMWRKAINYVFIDFHTVNDKMVNNSNKHFYVYNNKHKILNFNSRFNKYKIALLKRKINFHEIKTNENDNKAWVAKNKLLRNISVPLILNNIKSYCTVAYINLKYGHYKKHADVEYFSCLIICLSLFVFLVKKYNKVAFFIFLFMLIHLSNLTLISFVSEMIPRFIFYTEYVLYVIITASIFYLLHKKSSILKFRN